MRLEHENKMLRARQEGDSKEQVEVLQSMLDDASVHKNELESEIRSVLCPTQTNKQQTHISKCTHTRTHISIVGRTRFQFLTHCDIVW